MSKSSFNEIEQAIKDAAEAHELAFDEQAWKKMEVLLDKEKDRKRPIFFWLWLLVPGLLLSGLVSYFVFNDVDKTKPHQPVAVVKIDKPATENVTDNKASSTVSETDTLENNVDLNSNSSLQSKQKASSNKK